jgi:hypothetical protein
VTETDAEIRIRIDGRVDDGKSQKACSGGAIVTLSRAIGARTVVVTRGAGQVSATPLTLSGTLKDDVLYVGLS